MGFSRWSIAQHRLSENSRLKLMLVSMTMSIDRGCLLLALSLSRLRVLNPLQAEALGFQEASSCAEQWLAHVIIESDHSNQSEQTNYGFSCRLNNIRVQSNSFMSSVMSLFLTSNNQQIQFLKLWLWLLIVQLEHTTLQLRYYLFVQMI